MGKFSDRIGAPPAKRSQLVIEKKTAIEPEMGRHLDGSVLAGATTIDMCRAAARLHVPAAWLDGIRVPENPKLTLDPRWLAFCEQSKPIGQPHFNGNPASPDTLAILGSISAGTSEACRNASERAKERTNNPDELLLVDLLNAAYMHEALAQGWENSMRLRLFAELWRDRVCGVAGQADSTTTWILRATLSVAVKAKAACMPGHGQWQNARRTLLSTLEEKKFDLAACFPGAENVNERCRRLEDWARLFKNGKAGPAGLIGPERVRKKGEAQRTFEFLDSLLSQIENQKFFDDLCENVVWQQRLGARLRI